MISKLLQFKPDFLPQWLFWLLLSLGGIFALCVAAVGTWVLLTQIDFM